ncbi:MAG: hypothetical protein WCK78_19710 [Paludibacter sp.]
MDRYELIWEYQSAINEIYTQENLSCLRGLDNKCFINNRQIVSSFFEVAGKYKSNKDCIELIDEFIFISDEIMYFTAQLFLHKPYINNPLDQEVFINESSSLFPNNQNIAAKRYFMFVDITFEKIYNFWNRVGNLIALFFQEKFKANEKIYFDRAVDKVPVEFHEIEGYKRLKHFRENEYKTMNGKRKDIVHNISLDTVFRQQHIENATNRDEMKKWFDEIISFAEYFKTQMLYTIEGFDNTLSFLEEVEKIKCQQQLETQTTKTEPPSA